MPDLNQNSPFFHEERHASLAPFATQVITICGAGTLGANLTETLARMGFTRLRLIDRDRVEMRNLSVQPYSRAEVGAPKARALANTLYRALQARVEPLISDLTAANAPELLRESALVVDAFDNYLARAAVSFETRTVGFPCLHRLQSRWALRQWPLGTSLPGSPRYSRRSLRLPAHASLRPEPDLPGRARDHRLFSYRHLL
jgi:hypothetical protein